MTTRGNGHRPVAPKLPEGAVVLTEELFEATSTEWVELPQLSAKVSLLGDEEMLAQGWIAPMDSWSQAKREQVARRVARRIVLARRPQRLGETDEEWSESDRKAEADIAAFDPLTLTEPELLAGAAADLRVAGVWVQIGMVGYSEAIALQPHISGSEAWSKDPKERAEQFRVWYRSLADEQRREYDQKQEEIGLEFIRRGLIQPKFSAVQIGRLKDDAVFLAMMISRLSGMGRAAEIETPSVAQPSGATESQRVPESATAA